MARADDTELIDRFEEFYRNYYRNEIGELAQKYPSDGKSLSVDWQDLYRFDPDLADDFRNKPKQLREYAEEALRLYDLPVDVSLGQAHVRIEGLPDRTDIRDIRADHRGMLIAVQGIVRKATEVRPKITNAAFECQRCGTLTRIPQQAGDFQEPHECQGCERQGPFRINYDQSEFIDAQKLRIQESPEGLRGGETPQSIDVNIEDDITGDVTAGDHVAVTGILQLDQRGNDREKSPMFDTYMDGLTVEIEDEQFEEMEITDEDKKRIVELSSEPDLYELMEGAIAPSIYGYEREKRAMIFQLFSGVTKHLPDGSRTRGDLHMLLIGDPGTGKCLAGDQRVTLADGRRRQIRDLVEENLDDPKPVDDGVYDSVDVPVPSLTADGRIATRRATKVWKREAPDEMCRITTASGQTVEVTPSHPLFVQSDGGFTPREADTLREGTFVAAPETIPTPPEASPAVESRRSRATDGGGPSFAEPSVDASLRWERIDSIESVQPDDEWVYDLEVAGTHNYVSEGLVSHNSAMLQYIENIAPRSVYTSGKGSSAAGLTAAAVRDDFGDGQQWTLEAGALVLADQGIAAVDELDKMRTEDQSAMHEALEQQSYHPETEILLSDGRRVELGEFVDGRMEANPEEVVDGVDCEILPVADIGVHTTDLDTTETHKTAVDRVSRHEAPEEFVRVAFSNGREVVVTPDHPMFVDRDGGIDTVDARDIEAGAFVPAPRKLPNSARPVELDGEPRIGTELDVDLPEVLSPELGEILGLLVAAGHSYAGPSHGIGFATRDDRLLGRIERLMGSVFGLESSETTDDAGTVRKRYTSTKLYRWFESNVPELMHTARERRIPAAVLGGSEGLIRRFLVGAFAGDGSVEGESMSFSTASEGLARDYADALSKVGVASRIHHSTAEDSWQTCIMCDSTERFVDAVVQKADERHEKARQFVEGSNRTPRHQDVLPTSALRDVRDLRRLLGLELTGTYRPNVDEGYGIQMGTVERELDVLRERIETIRAARADATTLGDLREAIDWSERKLAERLDGVTTGTVHYAEEGGYDEKRRHTLARRARDALDEALAEARRRIDALEARTELRYHRVTDVEPVPNEGEEWVYDVTVEPTNTFVSQGVVLHNSISVSKAGINATLKSRCSLLGAANPTYGRFDQYEPIGEQIDLDPPLISRFDLIFTVTDQPDEEEDGELADHILKSNYAGELNTHRTKTSTSNYTEEEVERVTDDVAPTIEPELLRKYIAYARRNCYPTMTEEAKSEIREFYVDLRSHGTDEDAPVPVTARKLEALVRLAEASARVRLSDTVETEDARRAIDIAEYCLREIGMDPETGELDADVVETGTSKSQRERIRSIKTLVSDIEAEYDEGAPVDVVIERAEEEGMDVSTAEHEIDKLKQKGEVYEPQPSHLRTT